MTQRSMTRRNFGIVTVLGIATIVAGGSYFLRPPQREPTRSTNENYEGTQQTYSSTPLTQTPILNGLEELRKYKLSNVDVQVGRVRLPYEPSWDSLIVQSFAKDQILNNYHVNAFAVQAHCTLPSHSVPSVGVQARLVGEDGYGLGEFRLNDFLGVMGTINKGFTLLDFYSQDSGNTPVLTVSRGS